MCFAKGEFGVSVTKEEVVAAMLPLQEHWLPLSNLDLLLLPFDVRVFFCYKSPTIGGNKKSTVMECLKSALAEAPVSYYAFAGEVVTNSIGEPELLCNNRGVDFVEVVADVELQSLNQYTPDDSIQGKLVPTKKRGVLAIQATLMKCGGLVVACTFDHLVADAYSANMFLVSWAEMAHPNRPTTSAQPCFRRSLLTPRHPPSIHPSVQQMYIPISDLAPPPEPKPESDPFTSRIYYVTSEQINHMQSLATSSAGDQCTKLESFSAFLWKMVGAAAASAEGKEMVLAKMGVVVDGRKRLSNGDKNKEAIMGSYFGNVVSMPYGGIVAEELAEKPLSWVAKQVHEFLKIAVTEEHFLGLIDWVEVHRPAPVGLPRIYYDGTEEEGPAFVVSSGQRFSGSKVDFGWGKPLFASYYFPVGKGYVMPMPSPKDNGDWLVFMHLPKGHLHFMESKSNSNAGCLTWLEEISNVAYFYAPLELADLELLKAQN